MRTLALTIALLSSGALAQSGDAVFEQRDVRMFERVALGDEVSVVAFGVMEDTRCKDYRLCFAPDRLVVDTVLSWRGYEREVPLVLGVPHRVPGGTVTFIRTATPASDSGAIALKFYRMDFVYEPAMPR